MKNRHPNSRRGVVLVVVLLLIVVAGLTLSQTMDIENTLVKQQNEVYLKNSLAELRLAMEIACRSAYVRKKTEYIAFRNNPADSLALRNFIHVLLKEGLLPSQLATTTLSAAELDRFVPRDPTVNPMKWAVDSQSGLIFWKTKTNIIENSSFETMKNSGAGQLIASWTYDSALAWPDKDFPTILNVVEEDLDRVGDRYSSQNRFGQNFALGRGQSICCKAP